VLTSVLLVALQGAPTPLLLELPVGAPCPLEASLRDALAEEHVTVGPSPFKLTVSFRDRVLELSLVERDSVTRGFRSLPFEADDCPVLPHVIATLARAWLEASLREAHTEPPVPAMAPPRKTPAPAAPRPALQQPELPHAAAEPEPATAPILTAAPVETIPDAGIVAVSLEAPPLAVAPLEAPRVRAAPAPHTTAVRDLTGDMSLALFMLAGGAAGPGDQATFNGSLTAELGISEPWAIGIEGGIESTRSGTSSDNFQVSVQRSWAGATGRWAVLIREATGLYFTVGLRLERFAASVQRSSEVFDSTNAFTVGGVVGIEWRQFIVKGLFVTARLSGQIRPSGELFSTSTQTGVVNVPPIGFAANLGAGWSFF
jgi:hypothetical protein